MGFRHSGRSLRSRQRVIRNFMRGMEALEPRLAMAVFTVTNTSDSDTGSLRWAILQSEASPGADQIEFAIGQGPQTITLQSELPNVVNAVSIDARTQPGYAGSPIITLDGVNRTFSGLVVVGSNVQVRGLAIERFGIGVYLENANNVIVDSSYVGVDITGETAQGSLVGIVSRNTTGVVIGSNLDGINDANEGNVISGNQGWGILVDGGGTGTFIAGNKIGTNALGNRAVGNSFSGMTIQATNGNVVARNLIAGNTSEGIYLDNSSQNWLYGNLIGTDVTGSSAIPNGGAGVAFNNHSNNNLLGTNGDGVGDASERNLISGNAYTGVRSVGGDNNRIAGNYIGVNLAGNSALPNMNHGVIIEPGTSGNVIGVDGNNSSGEATEGNLISGNLYSGIYYAGSNGRISGNFVGLNALGTSDIPNSGGVLVLGSNNLVGTTSRTDSIGRNIVSGNFNTGIGLTSPQAFGNRVSGNYIGTNPQGTAALVSGRATAVDIRDGAHNNLIGGVGAGNVISGNAEGMYILFSGTDNNRVQSNYFGTDTTGSYAVGNTVRGIVFGYGASGTIIGSDGDGVHDADEGNVVAASTYTGIATENGAVNSLIAGNRVGTNAQGTQALPNLHGILVTNGTNTRVDNNLVSGNTDDGVFIAAGAVGTIVTRNLVGTDITGMSKLSNGRIGVHIRDGARDNVVGGPRELGNLISGNSNAAQVFVTEPGTSHNRISGNLIGTDITGRAILAGGVAQPGVLLTNGSSDIIVGTNADGVDDDREGNTIAGTTVGVNIDRSSNVVIAGNNLGTDIDGLNGLGNSVHGVYLYSAPGVRIGGPSLAERNIVASSISVGINVQFSSGTQIINNYVGTNKTGTAALPNDSGLYISNSTDTQVTRNLLSGNLVEGMWITDASVGTIVQKNLIGTNFNGTAPLPNGRIGIHIRNAAKNSLIGGTSQEGNLISGNNNTAQVFVSEPGTSSSRISGNLIGTDVTGLAVLPGATPVIGIMLVSGVSDFIIGTNADGITDDSEGNTLAGLTSAVYSDQLSNSVIAGNNIGTGSDGLGSLGNTANGVELNRSSGIRVGGSGLAERNLISGNKNAGISLLNTSAVQIVNNYIGTGKSGATARPNNSGIAISNSSGTQLSRNLVSGNLVDGVSVADSSTGTVVQQNSIGTNVSGNQPLPNGRFGIFLRASASNTLIGGTYDQGNLISANKGDQIYISDAGTAFNRISGNLIGTDVTGEFNLVSIATATGSSGVHIVNGASDTIIGTNSDGTSDDREGNVLSGNDGGIFTQSASRLVIAGNRVGTDDDGQQLIGNATEGIVLENTSDVRIGGALLTERNIVSGNRTQGIVAYAGSTRITVVNNYVGTNIDGTVALGNFQFGVWANNSSDVQIGLPGLGNLIAGNGTAANGGAAVALTNLATRVKVQGNRMGTKVDGMSGLGNNHGVRIETGVTDALIGGSGIGEGNLISGNALDGVLIRNSTTNVNLHANRIKVQGNIIGLSSDLSKVVGNGRNGINVLNGVINSVVGSDEDGVNDDKEGNVIAGNLQRGIVANGTVISTTFIRNQIYSNLIGLPIDLTLTTATLGLTPNDALDADSGPNGLLNFPDLLQVYPGAATRVVGQYSGAPNASIVVHFYATSVVNASGHGDAQRYLGKTTLVTDANGQASFDLTLQASTSPAEYVTSTATANGGTSEFSNTQRTNRAPVAVVGGNLTANEGTSVAFNGSESYDPDSDALTYSWDFGDGSVGSGATPAHTYADNGNYQVTLTVTDPFGLSSSATLQVVVSNVVPTVDFNLVAPSTLEGTSVSVTSQVSDPGADSFTYQWLVRRDGNAFAASTNPNYSFVASDNGLYSIELTVTDDDGGASTVTKSIAIQNVAPQILTLQATNAFEGGVVTLTGTYADPGSEDTHQVTINWGEGTPVTYQVSGGAFTLTHVYADDNPTSTSADSYVISALLRDDDAGSISSTTTAVITNVAPQLTALSATSANENGTVTLSGSYSDPGTQDIHQLVINWGEGSPVTVAVSGGTFSFTRTYLNNNAAGFFVIDVTLSDDDTGATNGSATTTITNVAPQVLTMSATNANENGVVTLSGTYYDPGTLDTHQITINWGEGGLETYSVSGGTFSFAHQYLDDNPTATSSDNYPISISLVDSDGAATTAATSTTITNVEPVLVTLAATNVSPNGATVLTGTYTDVGSQDTQRVTIAWGDGSTEIQTVTGGSLNFSHIYPTNSTPPGGVYTIVVTLTDDDGGSVSQSRTIQASNSAPQLLSLSATNANENGTVTLTGTYNDANAQDTHQITINWGEGAAVTIPVSGGSFSFTRQYLDDAPSGTSSDNYTINVSLADNRGATATASRTITISNVAPVVTQLTNSGVAVGSVTEGQTLTLTGQFTDVGKLDTHSAVINWGDGTSTTLASLASSAGAGTLSANHVYSSGGQYTITVTLTDDDGGTATATSQALVSGSGVSNGKLFLVGTPQSNVVVVTELLGFYVVASDFLPQLLPLRLYSTAGINELVIVTGGGDDTVLVAPNIELPTLIDGGQGNDNLVGGNGPNILIGGDGNDTLTGGAARDVLIGGNGADVIVGNSGDDLLIAGRTAYDQNYVALRAIMAEWNQATVSYENRRDHLRGTLAGGLNGSFVLTTGANGTVQSDGARDTLQGGLGRDLYFANVATGVDSVLDSLQGETNETIFDLL